MKYHRFQKPMRVVVLALLVFVLSTEPVMVAAKTLQKDPHAEATNTLINGGDIYLDSTSNAIVGSMELINYLNAINGTPLNQISESYISDVISRTLDVAEQSSVALGAANIVADGIENMGGDLPAAINVSQEIEAGFPERIREDLSTLGISTESMEQISAAASDLLAARQAGIPANVQADLISFGFTQSEINQISLTISEHGLSRNGLTTKLDQFRATQDELADTRSNMLVLAVQLLGYQIAIRQANGIAPTVITDDIMQELAQDELRLLVHAAHLNAMWGSDPSSEVGEGDWWFIEHYAGRAAERLQMITVESQNRGLVAELFVLHQMKMLAVSARTGDAGYVKAELDSLAALLSHQLNVTAYYQQRQNPGLAEMVWARMTATPALRENVEWGISDSVAKNAMIVLKERTETKKVENLPSILGSFDESNETNNTKGLLISTGLDFQEIGSATLDQILGLARPNVPDDQGRMLWLEAILTGQTDNIGLLLANIVLGFIPVINILVDVAGLLTSHSIIWISLGIIALICDIGSTAAFLSVQAELIGLPWLGRAVNSVVTSLAAADTALIAAFEMISQFEKVDPVVKAVNVWIQFFRTVIGKIIKTTGDLVIGHNLEGVIQAITDVLTGASRVWDGFKALCIRLEWGLIIELGINDGSLLLGRVINSGAEIVGDSEMLRAIKLVGEDLAKVGVELSDEAVDGLGKLTKQLGKDDLPKLMKELGTNPSLTDKVLASYKLFDADMLAGSGKIADAIGAENLGQVMLKYANDPAKVADINGDAVKIFGMLGNTVNANVLETAFQAGKATAGAGGPEALHTLALWGKSDLEKSSAIILAARAGRDYQTIQDVIKLITDHGNDLTTSAAKTLIEKMGVNSLQIGENSGLILLGKWSNGIDGGFANQARVLGADYFIVHPDVYDRLLNAFGKGEADEIFWMMDEAAIQHGIGKDMTFAYTTIDTPSEDLGKDLEILDQLDDIRNPTYNQAKNVILTVYDIKIPDPEEAYKKINFRMREILTAIKNNRKVIKSSDILFYLAP